MLHWALGNCYGCYLLFSYISKTIDGNKIKCTKMTKNVVIQYYSLGCFWKIAKKELNGSCIWIVSDHYSPKSLHAFTDCDSTDAWAAQKRQKLTKRLGRLEQDSLDPVTVSSTWNLCEDTKTDRIAFIFKAKESSPSWWVLLWLPQQKHDPDCIISGGKHNGTTILNDKCILFEYRPCSRVSTFLPLRSYLLIPMC